MVAGPLLAHLTELDAVNKILSSIGEDSISQLTDADDLADAALALDKLREKSREIQAQGYGCNTLLREQLSINNDDEFALPVDTLKVDTTYSDAHIQVSMRRNSADDKWILFDNRPGNNSETWSDKSTLYVDRVRYLPFNNLTPALQHHIMYEAGHEFQESSFGSVRLFQFTEQQREEARARVEAEEAENEDNNVLRNSLSAFDAAYRRNYLWGR